MSLLDYSTVIHHLVVVKALHDVQLTACIGCTEFCFQCIPELFAVFHVHIHITQTSIKNTQNAATEDSSVFLELILSFLRWSSSRRTITNFHTPMASSQGWHLICHPLKPIPPVNFSGFIASV